MFVCPECGLVQGQPGACPADGTQLAPRGDDPLVGMQVGVYRVARLLGVGGMGRVYKGVHPGIGSRVAIKVLSRECADRPELVERFFSEARAVNLIRHESIVNVLDLAQLPDGRPYIIMEYLDGAPLNDIVEKAGALPLGGLARLAAEVLDALGAAHAKGIVHRDLKPDNIFVTPAGHPKVLDFGIAKLRPELGGSYTQTGSLLGTPHYMSPEQAQGKPVDHRTDLYAMGVILFECATGQKPFNADSLFDLLRKHVDVAPPSPRALRPDMPPALEQVILTTLAKDPNQRFGSAAALSQALQAATAGLGADAWVPISPSTVRQMSAQRPIPTGGGLTPSWPPGWTPMHGTPPPGSMPQPYAQPGSMPPGAPQPYAQPGAMGPGGSMPPGYPQAMPPGSMPPGYPQAMPPGSMPPMGVGAPGLSGSTATSGQVVPKPGGGGKKGLWIGLGAVALIGGGIAIAVAASGGDDGGSSSAGAAASASGAASSGGGSAMAAGGGSARPAPAGSGSAPAGSGKGAAPAGSGKGAAPGGSGGSDDDDIDKQMAELDKQLDALGSGVDKMTADQIKQARDQLKQAQQAMQQLGSDADDPGGGGGGGGGGGPGYAGGPLAPTGGFDPKSFDVSGFYAQAEAEAKKIWPDVKLWRIDAEGVQPDGKANITLSSDFSVLYRFISPKHLEPPPGTPMGVKVDQKCVVYVNVDKDGIRSYTVEWECKDEKLIRAPKCTAAQVWAKAAKLGAPAKNAVAELGYRTDFDGNILWYFDIGDAFSQTIPDNC